MTTQHEHQLLLGRAYPNALEPEVSHLFDTGLTADLQAGSAAILAVLILLGNVSVFWGDLAPWLHVAWGTSLSLFQAVLTGGITLLRQLWTIRSWQALQASLLDVQGRIASSIRQSRLGRCVACVVDWYFPFNRPMSTVVRISSSFICGAPLYFGFLLPVFQFLNGSSAGLVAGSTEVSPGCVWPLYRFDMGFSQDLSDWVETLYCIGEETGLRMRERVQDDMQSLFKGDIHHCFVLGFVLSTIIVALLGVWLWIRLSQTAKPKHDDTDNKNRIPVTEREVAIWKMYDQYEIVIDRIKAQLATTISKLKRTRQERDEGWAEVEKLKAHRAQLEQVRSRHSDAILFLRREVGQVAGQLQMAKTCERALSDKVARLEQQLAQRDLMEGASRGATEGLSSLPLHQDDIDNLQELLAEAEAREKLVEADRQNLASRNSQLVGELKEVLDKLQKLQESHDLLIDHVTRSDEIVTRYETLEASYDQSLVHLRHSDNDRAQLVLRCQEIASECDALRISHEQLNAEAVQCRSLLVERTEQFELHSQALVAEKEDVTRKYESLQASIDQHPHPGDSHAAIQRDREEADARIMSLQQALDNATSEADEARGELQQSVAEARKSEGQTRQKMEDMERDCDRLLAQERCKTETSRVQVRSLFEQVAALRTALSEAEEDAQRSHQVTMEQEGAIKTLEKRLVRWEQSGGTQEIPKRQIGNPGSIATALEQKELQVVELQGEMNALKQKLALAQQGPAGSSDKDASTTALEKLRASLREEKRAWENERVHLCKRISELDAEKQRLTIAQSNAAARRPGPRKNPLAGR